MRSEVFTGTHLRHVFEDARRALGEDVVILHTEVTRRDGQTVFNLTATPTEDFEGLERRLHAPTPGLRRGPYGHGDLGPFLVALVGPTGAGKSTTVPKLALSPMAFHQQRVGVLTMDAYRVGALEQMGELAGLADLSLEIAYEPREVPRALARLDRCDVVVIDTPGRSPRASRINAEWRTMLRSVSPDEVHLMIPAGLRPALAARLVEEYADCQPTHALFAKVDEGIDNAGLLELADAVDLPVRWVTTGQDFRCDLEMAHDRVLSALGAEVPKRRMVAA